MKIYQSSRLSLAINNYRFLCEKYLSVGISSFFKLSTGKQITPEVGYKYVLEKYNDLVIDYGFPKTKAEWLVYGNAYRKDEDINYGVVSISLADSIKQVMIDFRNTFASKFNLNSLEINERIYVYENDARILSKLNTNFMELKPLDNERIKFAGDYSKCKTYELPEDFNFGYFSMAPLDQRVNHSWPIGAEYELNGVLPKTASLQSYKNSLPKVDLQVYSHRFNNDNTSSLILGNVNLDTVLFFPELDLGVMQWHCIFDANADFDTLIAVDAVELYTKGANNEEIKPSLQDYLAIAIAQHPQKKVMESPVYEIEKKIIKKTKEARTVKRNRYCHVYLDYMRFMIINDFMPYRLPLYRDRVTEDDIEKISIFYKDVVASAKSNVQSALNNNNLTKIIDHEILAEEKNFYSQLSALLEACEKNYDQSFFVNDIQKCRLNKFTIDQYYISYLDKTIECNYRDWGIDQDGTFTIPSGIIIPFYMGKEYLGAIVRPNGLSSNADEFLIPGSEMHNGFYWCNKIGQQLQPRVIVDDLLSALKLNEECLHYIDIIYMPNPLIVSSSDLSDSLENSPLVFVVGGDTELEAKTIEFKQKYANVQGISCGKNENEVSYKTLNEALDDPYFDPAIWLAPYVPQQITEPKYITNEYQESTFTDFMRKKMKLAPGGFDIQGAREKLLEEKRAEILSLSKTPEIKSKVNAAFDDAKAHLHDYDDADDITIIKASIEKQRQALDVAKASIKKNVKESMPDTEDCANLKVYLENSEQNIASAEQDLMDLWSFSQTVNKNVEKAIAEQNAAKTKKNEEIIQSTNLSSKDILELKNANLLEHENLYVYERSYKNCDLSGMKLKSSTFKNVDFSGANLTNLDFDGSTFTECCFDGSVLRGAKWSNVTLLKCSIKNAVLEENVFWGTEFLDCNLQNLQLTKDNFENANFSVGQVKDCYISQSNLKNTMFSFTKIIGLGLNDCEINSLNLENCSVENSNFETLKGQKLNLVNSKLLTSKITSSNFSRFEIEESDVEKLIIFNSGITSMIIRESNCIDCNFSKNVLTDFYARGSELTKNNFNNAVIKEGVFKDCNLQNSSFIHTNLFRSSLAGSRLGRANFTEANLFASDFLESKIADTDFTQANLKRTIFEYLMTVK